MNAPAPSEVFRGALHAMQSGDVQAWLDLCTDDVVFEFPFAPPGRPSRVEGKQTLGEYLAAIPSRVEFDQLSNLETHQTVDPDVAIFEMTATGRIKDTGGPYEMSYVVVLTVRDGRIAHYRDYWNPLKALSVEVKPRLATSSGQPVGRVLVTGASGTTGSRLAGLLMARGVAVTAANRSGNGLRGAFATRFDWYDTATHPSALAGVERLYLVPPSRDANPQAVMLPFLEKARNAGVRRVVLLSNSVVPAGGPGPGVVHEAIAEMFDEWAVLRPSWFMQNVTGNHPHAQSIRADSVIRTATGSGRVGFVDAVDIARVGIEALLSPAAPNADLILTGPEALSYDEVAVILSEASGRTITHVRLDSEELCSIYEATGLPSAAARFLAAMDTAIASGIENRTTDTVERVTGTAPRSFREFAAAEFRT